MKKRLVHFLIAFTLMTVAFAIPSSAQSCPCKGVTFVDLGVNTQEPPFFELARQTNVGWVRMGIQWSAVEATQGSWNFAHYDNAIATARGQGLKLLVILFHTPPWIDPAGGNPRGTKIAADPLWREFVRRVAQRYAGQIDAYEIWNEPDTDRFHETNGIGWEQNFQTPPTYPTYLRVASEEIKAASASTLVVGPAYRSAETVRTRELATQMEQWTYGDGKKTSDFIDVVSIHANGIGSEFSGNTTDRLKSKIDTINNRNPRNACKPKWVTEYGWASAVVGEGGQRDKIRLMTKTFSGSQSNSCTSFQAGTHLIQKSIHLRQSRPS